MSRVEISGLQQLVLDLDELARLPEEALLRLLKAQAQPVADAQQAAVLVTFRQHTGRLYASIGVDNRLRRDSKTKDPYLLVQPSGYHQQPEGKRGGADRARNARIAYILEYGAASRNLPRRLWMTTATQSAAGSALSAAEREYDQVLGELNF